MSHIGALIKNRRMKLGLSQGALSRPLGHTSCQFISNIERGKCVCPVPMAKLIASQLRITKIEIKDALIADFTIDFYKRWKE